MMNFMIGQNILLIINLDIAFILETAVSLTTFLISVMELKLAKVNS